MNGKGKERVTWLLPVKNGMPYLEPALASVRAQTYPHWEVLAWDNGSTDGTPEELRRWIPSILPGQVVSDRPLGLGAALAAMITRSTTELCARFDADDINRPDRLETQVAFLTEHPEVVAVGSRATQIDARGDKMTADFDVPLTHDDILCCLPRRNPMIHPSVLLRRSAVLSVGNYTDSQPVEDYELWYKLANHYTLANIEAPLLQYRVHDRSVTQTALAACTLDAAIQELHQRCLPVLARCRAHEAEQLSARTHPCALLLAAGIGDRRRRLRVLAQRLRSPWFQETLHSLTGNRDIVSRLFLAVFRPDDSLTAECGAIAKQIARRILG